jgi:hypothetical protein
MTIFRALFRLDYSVSYEVLDRPGSLLKTVMKSGGDAPFFDGLEESPMVHEVRGRKKTENKFREFKVSPTAIVVDFVDFDGIESQALPNEPAVATMLGMVAAVRSEFKLLDLTRLGIRLFHFSSPVATRKLATRAFENLLGGQIRDCMQAAKLQTAFDYGIAINGKDKDSEHGYNLRFGPFRGKDELKQYFPANVEPLEKNGLENATFVCDIDQYEVSVKYAPEFKWWKPMLQSADNVIPALEKIVVSEANKG